MGIVLPSPAGVCLRSPVSSNVRPRKHAPSPVLAARVLATSCRSGSLRRGLQSQAAACLCPAASGALSLASQRHSLVATGFWGARLKNQQGISARPFRGVMSHCAREAACLACARRAQRRSASRSAKPQSGAAAAAGAAPACSFFALRLLQQHRVQSARCTQRWGRWCVSVAVPRSPRPNHSLKRRPATAATV